MSNWERRRLIELSDNIRGCMATLDAGSPEFNGLREIDKKANDHTNSVKTGQAEVDGLIAEVNRFCRRALGCNCGTENGVALQCKVLTEAKATSSSF